MNIPFKYTYCVIYCTYTFCIFLCSLVVRPLFIEFFGVRSEFNFWFSLASFVLRPFFGRTYHCVFLTSSTCFRPVQKQFSTASRPLKKISHRFVTALIEFLAVPSLFVPFWYFVRYFQQEKYNKPFRCPKIQHNCCYVVFGF